MVVMKRKPLAIPTQKVRGGETSVTPPGKMPNMTQMLNEARKVPNIPCQA